MKSARIFHGITVDYFRSYENLFRSQGKTDFVRVPGESCYIEFKVPDWQEFLSEAIKCNALSIDGLKRFISEYEGKNDK